MEVVLPQTQCGNLETLAIRCLHFIGDKTGVKKGEPTYPMTHVSGSERKVKQRATGVKKKEG